MAFSVSRCRRPVVSLRADPPGPPDVRLQADAHAGDGD